MQPRGRQWEGEWGRQGGVTRGAAQEALCPSRLATELLAAGCGQQWAVGCARVGQELPFPEAPGGVGRGG